MSYIIGNRAPPRSLALLRGLRSRRRPRPSAPPAASAPGPPQPRGSGGARSSVSGGAGYGGTTEALQAHGLGKASGAAVAAPASRAAGLQRPLDPTSRYGAGTAAAAPSTSGREREAARPRGGWGPVRSAPPAARGPPLTRLPGSRKLSAPPHPAPVRPQHLSSLPKVCERSCHSDRHPRAGMRGNLGSFLMETGGSF
ncbi:3110021N24Rik [Phodopus roborovskii]|uniref:3110021N24Rik protein n=1 Tax=Phodopus roborovskii TaxID=109678 RepID=A0AAU9ZD74_PHORO|nr:3110021N24Rik [Phodopus roborovskii]